MALGSQQPEPGLPGIPATTSQGGRTAIREFTRRIGTDAIAHVRSEAGAFREPRLLVSAAERRRIPSAERRAIPMELSSPKAVYPKWQRFRQAHRRPTGKVRRDLPPPKPPLFRLVPALSRSDSGEQDRARQVRGGNREVPFEGLRPSKLPAVSPREKDAPPHGISCCQITPGVLQ